MEQVSEHVKKKHRVQTTTDTIANFVKKAIKQT
jgi:predicted small metal-binding protein